MRAHALVLAFGRMRAHALVLALGHMRAQAVVLALGPMLGLALKLNPRLLPLWPAANFRRFVNLRGAFAPGAPWPTRPT